MQCLNQSYTLGNSLFLSFSRLHEYSYSHHEPYKRIIQFSKGWTNMLPCLEVTEESKTNSTLFKIVINLNSNKIYSCNMHKMNMYNHVSTDTCAVIKKHTLKLKLYFVLCVIKSTNKNSNKWTKHRKLGMKFKLILHLLMTLISTTFE